MVRSRLALEHSILSMRKAYLWTFTFAEAVGPDRIGPVWNHLLTILRQALGYRCAGIRVFELHPGGHGCHVHVVCPYFWPVRYVREKVGSFGRIHVKALPSRKAASYCGKYLGKYRRCTEHRLPKGTRVWAAFGKWDGKVRVKDIELVTACGLVWDYLESVDWATMKRKGVIGGRESWTNMSNWDRLKYCERILAQPHAWPSMFPEWLVKELRKFHWETGDAIEVSDNVDDSDKDVLQELVAGVVISDS